MSFRNGSGPDPRLPYDPGPMTRVFSGMQPTGDATLGSLLGALRNWVTDQNPDAFYCVVDLHALTAPIDPVELRSQSLELATLFVAVGLDPEVCTVFVQSHVHQHAELAWLMECTASYGELSRMTQFKDRFQRKESVSGGVFTYPALMAADILLYGTEEVPVGDDQRQHVELTRDLAERFNSRYGPTFTVPKAVVREAGARVMDLQDPTRKMSKSESSPAGTILVLEDLKSVAKKIGRAVTDNDGEVRYDPATKPGVSNLLEILAACTGEKPDVLATRYTQYGPLKTDVAAAVTELLEPIQKRYAELSADPVTMTKVLEAGAERARAVAAPTLELAQRNAGLLPPSSR
ncbi:MAG: tryptophanyl-tRNA synthetase [Acidimicrobiaceae bacterium]